MAIPVVIPAIGESVVEGRLVQWFKKAGEFVEKDDPVCEIETDKATQPIPAPAAGILTPRASEDEIVAVGAVIGEIEPQAVPAKKDDSPQTPAPKEDTSKPAAKTEEPILSPAAKRAAEEEGVDPATVTGTGRDGRIIKEDIYAAKPNGTAKAPASQPVPAAPPSRGDSPRETRSKMSGIRQRIAERLVESQQTTATLTTFNEADMSAINDLRAKFKDKFKEKYGINLGFMSFFVKAVIEGLKKFPTVNARIDGNEIVHQHFYDIGVAVSTERGLMVPVIRNADLQSFAAIEKSITDVAVKARDNKISVADLQGGTFTITNGGIFGSMLSTPILNPPQTAILGMHSIQKRPVVVNDQIVVRPMMYLALSYDHRLIDGREAVQFLVRVKECLEQPERLLLEI
ncbi:MAG: 2-oxoglutarate dehydrogenase complex dihydrolipoyllysine-residue succinyltransferase [Zavarzinella sp.]